MSPRVSRWKRRRWSFWLQPPPPLNAHASTATKTNETTSLYFIRLFCCLPWPPLFQTGPKRFHCLVVSVTSAIHAATLVYFLTNTLVCQRTHKRSPWSSFVCFCHQQRSKVSTHWHFMKEFHFPCWFRHAQLNFLLITARVDNPVAGLSRGSFSFFRIIFWLAKCVFIRTACVPDVVQTTI